MSELKLKWKPAGTKTICECGNEYLKIGTRKRCEECSRKAKNEKTKQNNKLHKEGKIKPRKVGFTKLKNGLEVRNDIIGSFMKYGDTTYRYKNGERVQ